MLEKNNNFKDWLLSFEELGGKPVVLSILVENKKIKFLRKEIKSIYEKTNINTFFEEIQTNNNSENFKNLPVVKCKRVDGMLLKMINKCPFCKKKRHTHGAVSYEFGAGNGSRVPHCDTFSDDEYYLVEVI